MNSERTRNHFEQMDSLSNNITQPYDEGHQGFAPIEGQAAQKTIIIFQGILQFLHFVINKRNITHDQYLRIHNEFVR